jgi:hypothetical protein
MDDITNESCRVADVAHNSRKRVEEINAEFETQTKLNKVDIAFLFFATALQCVRQYLLTGFNERVNDQTAAKSVNKVEKDEASKTVHETVLRNKKRVNILQKPYEATLEEIIEGPVPFDVIAGGSLFNLGLSGFNHRKKTLGHDPVLGWIFGTTNIATNTITIWRPKTSFPPLASYHVGKQFTGRGIQNAIKGPASTIIALDHLKSKLLDEGKSGKLIVAYSLLQEYIHLKSDINSFQSLPLPIINGISTEFADKLASYGIDTGNMLAIGKQASFALMINILIGMIHSLFYNEAKDKSSSLYLVRTNKILTYSNIIASSSNALYVLLSSYFGDKTSVRKLDIGGFIVTIHQILHDEALRYKIKEEFITENFIELIKGTPETIEENKLK